MNSAKTDLNFLQFGDHVLTQSVDPGLGLFAQLYTLSLVCRDTGLCILVMGRQGGVDRGGLFGSALTVLIDRVLVK